MNEFAILFYFFCFSILLLILFTIVELVNWIDLFFQNLCVQCVNFLIVLKMCSQDDSVNDRRIIM